MLSSLLDTADGSGNDNTSSIVMLVILAVLIVVIIVFYVMSSKKRKKQEQDAQNLINAVKPGNKVKTIGGICGIVVEVDEEENTFVLETGTEASGKSYIKFDKQAIYQTDAVVEKQDAVAESSKEAPAEDTDGKAVGEEPSKEAPAEDTDGNAVAEEPSKEAPAAEDGEK